MSATTFGDQKYGDQMPQGERGPEGPAGPAGGIGPPGPAGPAGDVGAVGPAGPAGGQGLPGVKGDTGATGGQGSQGLPGLPGAQGIQGLPGSQGIQGLTGPAGPAGSVPMVRKSADQAFTLTALADVTGLSFPVTANTDYFFDFLIVWASAAATTGVRFALNGPAAPVELTATVETQLTATTWDTKTHVGYDGGAATASVDTANVNRVARIRGVLRNGANAGTLTVRCASEVAASAITVRRGSYGLWS